MEADKSKYVCSVTAVPSDTEKERLEDLGIVGLSSYSLLAATELIDKKKKKVKLVKLRNPWGKFEWEGDWSDKSDCWTDQLKK